MSLSSDLSIIDFGTDLIAKQLDLSFEFDSLSWPAGLSRDLVRHSGHCVVDPVKGFILW